MQGLKVLFLAARVQPFLVSGIHFLLEQEPDAEVLLYCQHQEDLQSMGLLTGDRFRVFTYEHQPETFFWEQIESFRPSVVYCAGWMFSQYLSWSAALKKKQAITICAMDTQWRGSLRQQLFAALFKMLFRKRCFSKAWVPGERQKQYAIQLGFAPADIMSQLYAVDSRKFATAYESFRAAGLTTFPKRLVYVGRLEPHKLLPLLQAIHNIPLSELGAWRVDIYGEGSMRDHVLLQHPAIRLHAAVYAEQLLAMAAKGGVFCLCSKDEPWGMVIQEFAAAGMPLLVSKQCGASDVFFDATNGRLCDGLSQSDIEEGILYMIGQSDAKLFEMSARSHDLGTVGSTNDWYRSFMTCLID